MKHILTEAEFNGTRQPLKNITKITEKKEPVQGDLPLQDKSPRYKIFQTYVYVI
jgi:hypothetical protein